jgi:hypothetical protein
MWIRGIVTETCILGISLIPTELLEAGGRAFHSGIHK